MANATGTTIKRPTLDTDEVAALVRCHPAHIRRLVRRGAFPAPIAGLGRLVRFDRAAVLAFLRAPTIHTAAAVLAFLRAPTIHTAAADRAGVRTAALRT